MADGPEGPVQTAAFEIEGEVIRALYVVRNPGQVAALGGAIHAARELFRMKLYRGRADEG